MSDTYEVISAFLDDEPFDPHALAAALAEPAGRSLLIDSIALRHLVQPPHDTRPLMPATGTHRLPIRAFATAAALLVALAGGYLAGQGQSAAAVAEPPEPTRVVQAPAAWQDLPISGRSTP
jgi:hypothetical protein